MSARQDPRGRAGGTSSEAEPVCLGWQFAPGLAEPPAPPAMAASVPVDRFDPGWLAAQTRISAVASRPARAGAAVSAAVAALLGGASLAAASARLPGALGGLICAAGSAAFARSALRARRRLASVIAGERQRVAAAREVQARLLERRQREYTSQYRAWQRRRGVAARQQAWLPVALPPGIDRVDVAGGSLAGWAALITTVAAPRLSAGGEITIIDLTEGAVATELIHLAQGAGLRPLVWVLPGDLPRLDLGNGLGPQAFADVLALAAAAATTEPRGRRASGHRGRRRGGRLCAARARPGRARARSAAGERERRAPSAC